MLCSACGNGITKQGAKFCPLCGAPVTMGDGIPFQGQPYVQPQNMQYAPPPQDLAQIGKAMHDYIKVDMEPRISKVGIIVAIVLAVLISSIGLIDMSIGFLFIGLAVGAVFMLIVWLVYKLNITASQRLKAFFANDGEARVLMEFASSQPFAKDQFRLSLHYVFIKNRCAVRIIDITNVTRVKESYNLIPTGVRLDVRVEDETGVQNVTVCRLHMTKSRNEADEYFGEIMQRQQMAVNEINMQRY